MNTKTIRRASTEDIPLLTDILNDALAFKLELGDPAWGTQEWTLAGVGRWLNKSEMYLIEQENMAIATFSLAWEDEKYWGQQEPIAGYLHRLAVRKEFHGIGAGDFALDWAMHQIRARHRQALRLDCDCRNTSLCAYYEARGFVQVGVRPIPGAREYIASLYEKALA
jgi:ribosomal protein S18 acetylase RimI-like enzyme